MRWIRLDTSWTTSDWLLDLEPESRLAWVQLLCYVKANGYDGRAKAMSMRAASSMWFVSVNAANALVAAATAHGALAVENGEWVIVKWAQFQGDATGKERFRRFKERRSNATNALATPTETGTETKTETQEEKPPKSPRGEKTFPTLVVFLPEGWAAVSEPWDDYQHYRHTTPGVSPYQEAGCQRLAAMLLAENYTPDKFIRLLDHCLASGWKGIPIEVLQKFEHTGNAKTSRGLIAVRDEMLDAMHEVTGKVRNGTQIIRAGT